MPSVKKYRVTPLAFDQKLVEQVMRRRTDGESLAVIATALKITAGKAAMAELLGTVEAVQIEDAAKLARAVAKSRKEGRSWGWLAARFRITEGSAKAAFVAATGQAADTLDFRKKVA
jgi:hypothetical protein